MSRPLAWLLLASTLACGAPAVEPEALMDADRKFQAETAEHGVEGWVEAFAVDGKLIAGGNVIEGRDAIAEAMEILDSPEYSLTWEPEFAEGSGDLGYTYGSYRRETSDAEGNTAVETGRYLTIWRRDANGEWKAVMDLGSAASP